MGDEITVKTTKPENNNINFASFTKLVQVMQDDPLINEKVITILKLDSFQRRNVLNNWLEQLRTRKAPENLLNALSCLFDDKIAEEVLTLINNS